MRIDARGNEKVERLSRQRFGVDRIPALEIVEGADSLPRDDRATLASRPDRSGGGISLRDA